MFETPPGFEPGTRNGTQRQRSVSHRVYNARFALAARGNTDRWRGRTLAARSQLARLRRHTPWRSPHPRPASGLFLRVGAPERTRQPRDPRPRPSPPSCAFGTNALHFPRLNWVVRASAWDREVDE